MKCKIKLAICKSFSSKVEMAAQQVLYAHTFMECRRVLTIIITATNVHLSNEVSIKLHWKLNNLLNRIMYNICFFIFLSVS